MSARGTALEFAAHRTVFRQTLVPGCALLACALVAAHAPAGVRAPFVIAFLCVVPGAALVGLLSPDSLELEIALAIGLSVALSALTAAVLVYAHLWSPTAVVLIVAAVSLVGGLRDVALGARARRLAARLVESLRAVSAAAFAAAQALARRAAAGMFVAVSAAADLAGRVERRRRVRVSLVAARESSRHVQRRLRKTAGIRPRRSTEHRLPPRPAPAPSAPESSLQNFLLDELRRSPSRDSRRRRPPRSLAALEPHELDDLLSWSALQRFVAHRAVQQVNPELWFVHDLERPLGRPGHASRGARPAAAPLRVPRGVWITGVSEGSSVPLAWRVLEENARGKEWRTRLALEAIDTLSQRAPAGAVVTAGTAHGSLSGFRGGLEERGLAYLVRVDAVTAARELALERPNRSAEARDVVRRRLADGAATLVDAQANGRKRKSELVLVHGVERLVLCEVPAAGHVSAFWVSNLPAGTPLERLAFLIRLAHRHQAERTSVHELLLGTLGTKVESGAELQQQLARVALAQGLSTLGVSAAPAREAVEA